MTDRQDVNSAAGDSSEAGRKTLRTAILYVMFEEYELLERQMEALNGQSYLRFTFVCVSGYRSDGARIRATLNTAVFPTVLIVRDRDNGPAGGFWDGQAWCLAQGFDVIVHVESDCFPTTSDLVERLVAAIDTHAVAVPLCMPDGIPMGWRWCAVRAAVLREVGLSYRELYSIAEDIYFYRNITRRHDPSVLTDVSVYHPPVAAKYRLADAYLASLPFLWSRNFILFPLALLRTHRQLRDVAHWVGYFASLCMYATHLWVRGKRESAVAVIKGLVAGVMFREDLVIKDRMESAATDYVIREVTAFEPERVFDKAGFDIGAHTIAAAFGCRGQRVLLLRTSQIVLIVCLFLAQQLAVTDGQRVWLLKDRPLETRSDVVVLYLVLALSLLVAIPALMMGLVCSAGSHPSNIPSSLRQVDGHSVAE